jgi:hypothetical protein
MNIVTIMNYDWNIPENIELCKIWINQASIWLNKFDTVYVYTEHRLHDSLVKIMNSSISCTFKNVACQRFIHKNPIHFGVINERIFSNHNFLVKLYTTCNINFPYLFLDSDAFIVDSLEELRDIFDQTQDRVLFIDHETNIPNETEWFEPFINSGVFLMNDPEHIIYNWEQIYTFAEKKNFTCKFNNISVTIPGSDQAVLKSYFDYIGYDYHHKSFDIAYNTSASMINQWFTNNASDNTYQTTLKNNPLKKCKIVHYWGKNKLNINNCPLFKEN